MTNPSAQTFVNSVISTAQKQPVRTGDSGKGQAPVNIALGKYWGKRDVLLNLPVNSSLSISLPGLGTETTLSVIAGKQPSISLNQQKLDNDHPFAKRVSDYLAYFNPLLPKNTTFDVNTENSVPTGAGLASSASGYAALVLALNNLFHWQLPPTQLSLLARLGSGSASRSLFNGFAIWHKGEQKDGLDSFAEPITTQWSDLRVGLIKVDISEKAVGSTAGMQRTVETCDLYQAWPAQAEKDVKTLQQAIETKDFTLLGTTAEHNALTMHATMMATWPPIVYWQPSSVEAMQTVWQLRKEGTEVYFTMDAGPNLKLLFLETQTPAIKRAFPEMDVIKPF